jgi:hypothetical protein
MKTKTGAWLVWVMLFSFWLGIGVLFIAWQLRGVASRAEPAPQALSLAELIDKGPGDNLHVELTGFTFGAPVIEKNGEYWSRVWLPLVPVGQKKGAPKQHVFFDGVHIRSQSQLDDLLKQDHLDVLVASSMHPLSLWKVHPSDEMKKVIAKLPAAKVLYLAEPDFAIGEVCTLPPSIVFAWTTAQIVTGVAAWLLGGSAFCLLLAMYGRTGKVKTGAMDQTGTDREYERGRLAVENPLSVHSFTFWDCLMRASVFFRGAAVALVLSLIALPLVLVVLAKANLIGAIVILVISFALLICSYAGIRKALQMTCGGVSEIAVCPSGLRWKIGNRQEMALWSDIGSVKVQEYVTTVRGVRKDWYAWCLIWFRLGGALHLWSDALSNFVGFINAVQGQLNAVNQASQSQQRPAELPATRSPALAKWNSR